jgi:ATP-dependent protease HslVU (ClpYQ) ATPase subunit
MIRDLVQIAVQMVRDEEEAKIAGRARERALHRIADLLAKSDSRPMASRG